MFPGLCGAVHTNVSRFIRGEIEREGKNINVVCVGDKSRQILQRLYGKNIIMAANEIGRLPPTFLDASKLTNAIFNSGQSYSSGKIIYNKFNSVVSCTTTTLPVFSQDAVQVRIVLCFAYSIFCFTSLRRHQNWQSMTPWTAT